MQKFPLGTRVVYPPDALPGIRDVNAAIRHALLHPTGDSQPLPDLLKAGMKLTIAVDDISIPLPPMTRPDIRQRILEQVIELAARKGVEDVQIVVATALHRRMTADEIRRMVGRAGLPFLLAQGPLQLRRRGQGRAHAHRDHRRARGRRDLQARRGVGPPRLRQREPGRDGRRAQVGRDRPGRIPLAPTSPQRRDDDALAVLHGPEARA